MIPAFFRRFAAVLCAAASLAAFAAAASAAQQPAASSADPAVAAVKERFHERFPNLDVERVSLTPYGLYEVQVGMNMVYTDAKVDWVLEGHLIDAMTRRDVTKASIQSLSNIAFDKLPLNLAIKKVQGNGERRVAIFEDPNCGYCRQLRRTLQKVDNVTIYTFLYPILAPDSAQKSSAIWCAKDPATAWDDWMLKDRMPAATTPCKAPIGKLLALGQKLMVTGTPTLYFADGTHISGALPLDMLQARLDGQGGQD